jgi:hypothetical protein
MKWVYCFLLNLLLFLLVAPLAASVQTASQQGSYAEGAFSVTDPGSLLLIGLGLVVVGMVGTRALRG